MKALSLIDIGINDLNESTQDFQSEDISRDDFIIGEYQTFDHCSSDPEHHLMSNFNTEDLLAFIKQFVIHGRSKELYSVGSSKETSRTTFCIEKKHLFATLIVGSLQSIGSLGNTSKSIFEFLRLCIDCFGSELALSSTSAFVAQVFSSQMMTTLNQVLRCKIDNDLGSLRAVAFQTVCIANDTSWERRP